MIICLKLAKKVFRLNFTAYMLFWLKLTNCLNFKVNLVNIKT